MQKLVIILSVLGLAVANPVDIAKVNENLLSQDVVSRNSVMENLVNNLLEDLRKTMVTGSDDIPVLDPLEVDHFHLDEQTLPVPSGHVILKDLVVSKLSTFVVDTLSINTASFIPLRYRLTFDIHIPVLEVIADNYDLQVSAAGANIFGNGDATINLIEPRVKGELVVGPRISIGAGLYYSITSSDVHLSLKGFQSQINGLMNDEAMSAFINTFLGHLVPEAIVLYEKDINKFLSETVQEIGNELLSDFNLAGILG
uniref:Uncharacterized protein n=1 Tax=Heliothis virescens TaxID=7102 RepID=A0A2A4JFJ3_HELVI